VNLRLTLYVAGDTSRSATAIRNLQRLRDSHLDDEVDIEVVDVVQDPDRAETTRILTTPTLVREAPAPQRRVTGDLGDAERVMVVLGIPHAPTSRNS
jgi:circadian clock protein KaiB